MKQPVTILLSVAASIFFLWVAFHGISFSIVWSHLRAADPVLLLLAVINHTLGIHIRAIRWKYLLIPVTRTNIPFRPRLSAPCLWIYATRCTSRVDRKRSST
jgi:uncharacterized membrane protein YbhN (UPF0104 family)